MTTAITTRAGKGSELTWPELDANLTNLQTTADAAMAMSNLAANFNTFRNRIVNGDMAVSQVNGATAVTPAASAYVIDQFKASITQASKLTFQQVADAPAGLKYSTKISVAAQYAPLATDVFTFAQPIEGQNIIDMQFGQAGAATVAASFWAKASVAGTYTCFLQNGAGNRCYVGAVALTTAWARYTVALVADTTGTWATDNTAGLWLGFDLGSGANFNVTAGAWAAGALTRTSGSVSLVNQAVGSTLNITGVQIEDINTGTTTASSFEYLPYEAQLRRCQRYLPAYSGDVFIGYSYSTTQTLVSAELPVPTRVPVTGYTTTTLGSVYNGSNASGAASSVAFSAAGANTALLLATTVAGTPTLTAGQGGRLQGHSGYFTGAQM